MKNDHRSSNRGPSGEPNAGAEAGSEETIRSERIQVERKLFLFTLKENPRGRFLRITEEVGGRRDTIIVPATGLAEFAKIIEELAQSSAQNPAVSGAEPGRQP